MLPSQIGNPENQKINTNSTQPLQNVWLPKYIFCVGSWGRKIQFLHFGRGLGQQFLKQPSRKRKRLSRLCPLLRDAWLRASHGLSSKGWKTLLEAVNRRPRGCGVVQAAFLEPEPAVWFLSYFIVLNQSWGLGWVPEAMMCSAPTSNSAVV